MINTIDSDYQREQSENTIMIGQGTRDRDVPQYSGDIERRIIHPDNFKLPDMGDYYNSAIEYKYISEFQNAGGDMNSDAYKFAFYSEQPPVSELGYHADKRIYALNGKPDVSQRSFELGAFDADTMYIPLNTIKEGSHPGFNIGGAEFESFLDYMRRGDFSIDPNNDTHDRMGVRLLGMDAKEIPHMAKRTYSVGDRNVRYQNFTRNQLSDFRRQGGSHIFTADILNQESNVSVEFVSFDDGNKWHQVSRKEESGSEAAVTFLIAPDGETPEETQKGWAQTRTAQRIVQDAVDVKVIVDMVTLEKSRDFYPTRIFYERYEDGAMNQVRRTLNNIVDNNRYVETGFNFLGMDPYKRYLGEIYLKVPVGKLPGGEEIQSTMDEGYAWVNLAKYIIAMHHGDIEVWPDYTSEPMKESVFGLVSNAFNLHTYSFKNRKYYDHMREVHYKFDDRRRIQKEILGKNFEELKEWTVILGDAVFMVPPTSIRSLNHTNNERMQTMRSNGSMSKGSPTTQHSIEMTLYFNGDEGINGYPYTISLPNGQRKLYHMNGLRALIAMFKMIPFLPIENYYINEVLNTEAVVLSNFQISTMPDYPKTIAATLTMERFEYRVYMPELPIDADRDESEPYYNIFASTINFEVLRWHYQRALERGRLAANHAFNTIEHINIAQNGKLALKPAKFESSNVRFFVPNENQLDVLKQIKIAARRHSLDSRPKVSEHGIEVAKNINKTNESLNKLFSSRELNQVLDEINYKFERGEILLDLNNYHESKRNLQSQLLEDASGLTKIIESQLIKDNSASLSSRVNIETDGSKVFFEFTLNPSTGVSSSGFTNEDLSSIRALAIQQDEERNEPFKGGLLHLRFSADVQATGDNRGALRNVRGNLSYDGSTPDQLFLNVIRNLAEGTHLDDEIAGMKDQMDRITPHTIEYVEHYIPETRVQNIAVSMGNVLSPINLNGINGYAPQFMGQTDNSIEINIETTDYFTVFQLQRIPDLSARYVREYRDVLPSWPLRIDSEVTGLFGIYDVLIEAVEVNTVPSQPGLFQISMKLLSVDKTLRNKETLDKINRNEYLERRSIRARSDIQQRNYFDLMEDLSEVPLYPDLELPTHRELEEAGFHFIKHINLKKDSYVDPDFYHVYGHIMSAEIFRESIMAQFSSEEKAKYILEDQAGGTVDIEESSEYGVNMVDQNDVSLRMWEKAIDDKEIVEKTLQTSKSKAENREKDRLTQTQKAIQSLYEAAWNTHLTQTWDITKEVKVAFADPQPTVPEVDVVVGQSRSQSEIERDNQIRIDNAFTSEVKSAARKIRESAVQGFGLAEKQLAEYRSEAMQKIRMTFDNIEDILDNIGDDGVLIFIERIQLGTLDIETEEVFVYRADSGLYYSEYSPMPSLSADDIGLLEANDIVKDNLDLMDQLRLPGNKEWNAIVESIGNTITSKNRSFLSYSNKGHTEQEDIRKSNRFGYCGIPIVSYEIYKKIMGVPPLRETAFNGKYFLENFHTNLAYKLYPEKHASLLVSNSDYNKRAMKKQIALIYTFLVESNIIPSGYFENIRDQEESIKKLLNANRINYAYAGGRVDRRHVEDLNMQKRGYSEKQALEELEQIIETLEGSVEAVNKGNLYAAGLLSVMLNASEESFENMLSLFEQRDFQKLNKLTHIVQSPGLTPNAVNYDVAEVFRNFNLSLSSTSFLSFREFGTSIPNLFDLASQLVLEKVYLEAADNPALYIPHSFYDMIVHDKRGRMLRAFPTFYMLMVDKGRRIGQWKLFDNFYNISAIHDIQVNKSRRIAADTATITMSNMFNSYTEDDEDIKENYEYDFRDVWGSFFRTRAFAEQEYERRREQAHVDRVRLQPGIRLMLKMGYGSDASKMPTMFNGSVAEIETGDVVTMLAQGDGKELLNPIMMDAYSEQVENQDSFATFISNMMSNSATPKEILTALLTSRGGWLKKQIRRLSDGRFFDDNPFGIANFGDPDHKVIFQSGEAVQNIFEAIDTPRWGDIPGTITNQYAMEHAPKLRTPVIGKTVWDILHICGSVSPDFVVGITPFGLRSTIFHGAPRYYYAWDYEKTDHEVIYEKRKPFQQFKVYTSYSDIIQNNIKATEDVMNTAALGMYQRNKTIGKTTQNVGPLWASFDIYPEKQKTMVVDTQLDYGGIPVINRVPGVNALTDWATNKFGGGDSGVMQSGYKIAWRMTAHALKESMKDMYQGELIVLGDPTVKPHDRMFISDIYENMNGQCLVEGVTHHMSPDTGFISSVYADAIATVDDRHELAVQTVAGNVAAKAISTTALTVLTTTLLAGRDVKNFPLAKSGATIGNNTIKLNKKFLQMARKAKLKPKGLVRGTLARTIREQKRIGKAAVSAVGSGKMATLGLVGVEMAIVTGLTAYAYEMIERRMENYKVLTVFPLKKDGRVYTAGLNGSAGLVYGCPSYEDPGIMGRFIRRLDYKDGEFSATIPDILRWLFVSDNMRAIARSYQNMEMDPDHELEVVSLMSRGTSEVQAASAYYQSILKPRIRMDQAKVAGTDLTIHDEYMIDQANDYLEVIKDHEGIKPFVARKNDQSKFIIAHDYSDNNDRLESASYVIGKDTKIKGYEIRDGAIIYKDIPMLHKDALSLLAEISERYFIDYKSNKDLILKSALRIGGATESSTGLVFVLQPEDSNILNKVLREITEEVEGLIGKSMPFYEYVIQGNDYYIMIHPERIFE